MRKWQGILTKHMAQHAAQCRGVSQPVNDIDSSKNMKSSNSVQDVGTFQSIANAVQIYAWFLFYVCT